MVFLIHEAEPFLPLASSLSHEALIRQREGESLGVRLGYLDSAAKPDARVPSAPIPL